MQVSQIVLALFTVVRAEAFQCGETKTNELPEEIIGKSQILSQNLVVLILWSFTKLSRLTNGNGKIKHEPFPDYLLINKHKMVKNPRFFFVETKLTTRKLMEFSSVFIKNSNFKL